MAAGWSIEIGATAQRLLRKLDPPVQRRVARLISSLAVDPRPAGCKKLVGTANLWRVRTGDYRVVYAIKDAELLIIIVDLGGREHIYD